MSEAISSFCGHCGQYLRPDEGQPEIIDGELVMLCGPCGAINENSGVRIEGMAISKTKNARACVLVME